MTCDACEKEMATEIYIWASLRHRRLRALCRSEDRLLIAIRIAEKSPSQVMIVEISLICALAAAAVRCEARAEN